MRQIEEFRQQIPAPLALRPLNIPEPTEIKLANGMRVVTVEDKRLPLVSFRLAMPSGDVNDPENMVGLSDMMTHLMSEGTQRRTSKQIAEEVERIGATLSAGSGSDFTTVAASALAIYADDILELMADIVQRPSFPQNEIDLARENAKQLLIQQRAQPTFLASERVAKVIFGNHPYSRVSPTPETLDAMTRDALKSFHASLMTPKDAVMVVVGDIDQAALIDRLDELFGKWQPSAAPALSFPGPPVRATRSACLVDRPGSAQSNIVVANIGISRTSPDYFPMLLMHTVLGANASSRLFMNLREEKGYTYGAYSSLDARRVAGSFRVTAEVRTPVTGASLKEFFYELERIRSERVSDKELADAKSYLTGVFPIKIETQEGLIEQLVSIRMYNLPDDYLHTYRDRINAISSDEILRVAQQYVTPDKAAVVIVGDANAITDQVKVYSEAIEFYDTAGRPKTKLASGA
jgi:zinc protease